MEIHTKPDIGRWLTLSEAATYANVSPTTLRREAKSGRLRGCKVGGRRLWRFRFEDIDTWLETQEEN